MISSAQVCQTNFKSSTNTWLTSWLSVRNRCLAADQWTPNCGAIADHVTMFNHVTVSCDDTRCVFMCGEGFHPSVDEANCVANKKGKFRYDFLSNMVTCLPDTR